MSNVNDHRYCPECLKEGLIYKVEEDEDGTWSCSSAHAHPSRPDDPWSWKDVQHLATVMTITQSDPKKLTSMVRTVQNSRRSKRLLSGSPFLDEALAEGIKKP